MLSISELLSEDMPHIVTIGVVHKNKLLTGLRRDNGKWTSPGGHMDPGESPEEAARRELFEESGLVAISMTYLGGEKLLSFHTKKPFMLYTFMAEVADTTTSTEMDPDNEISEWRWVDIDRHQPELQPDARHAKVDNVLVALGIWHGAAKLSRKPLTLGLRVERELYMMSKKRGQA